MADFFKKKGRKEGVEESAGADAVTGIEYQRIMQVVLLYTYSTRVLVEYSGVSISWLRFQNEQGI